MRAWPRGGPLPPLATMPSGEAMCGAERATGPALARRGHAMARRLTLGLLMSLCALGTLLAILFLAPTSTWALPQTAPATSSDTSTPLASCTRAGLTAFRSSTVVSSGEWVCGDITLLGGTATVLGHVSGNITAIASTILVTGRVDGDIVALGGTITVVAGARIDGAVRSLGGQVRWEHGASITGGISRAVISPTSAPTLVNVALGRGQSLWGSLLFWTGASLLLVALFPSQLGAVRSVVRGRALASLAAGVVVSGVGLVVGALLVLSCLGIPLAFFLFLSLWLAWVAGTVAVGAWIGEALVRTFAWGAMAREHAERMAVVPTLVGTLLLAAAKTIPCGGQVLALVVGLGGVGAVTLCVSAAVRFRRAPSWQA